MLATCSTVGWSNFSKTNIRHLPGCDNCKGPNSKNSLLIDVFKLVTGPQKMLTESLLSFIMYDFVSSITRTPFGNKHCYFLCLSQGWEFSPWFFAWLGIRSSVFWANCSLFAKKELMSDLLQKQVIRSFTHFWWANCSWSLIFGEQTEWFAHIAH